MLFPSERNSPVVLPLLVAELHLYNQPLSMVWRYPGYAIGTIIQAFLQ